MPLEVLSETEEIVPFFSANTSQFPWVYHFEPWTFVEKVKSQTVHVFMSRIVVSLNAIHMPRVVHVELSLWMFSILSLSTSNSKSLSLRTVLRSFWCSHLALRTTWNTLVRQSSEVTPSWDPKVTCLSCARAKLGVLGWVCSRDIWFLTLDFGGLLFLSKRFRQCQFGLPMCSRENWFDKKLHLRSLLHNWGWSRQRPLLVPFLYIIVSCLRSSTARWRMVGS